MRPQGREGWLTPPAEMEAVSATLAPSNSSRALLASSQTDDLTNVNLQATTRPVLVQQAETGSGHLLPLAEDDSVFALKEAIQGATGVPATYQILLLDGDKLEDKQTLAEYMLPDVHASARPVFLFDRRALSRSAEPPELTHPTAPDIDVPESLPADRQPRPDVEQESIPSPLVRALLDYERRFCLHLQQATALCDGGHGRLGAARQALVEQRVQAAALTAAVANLRGFAQQLSEKCAPRLRLSVARD